VDPTIKALVLTSYDDERALLTAVLAGASAFVLKDIRGNGLVETIRRVAAGENLLDTEQAHELVAGCRVHGNADRRLRVLTPQERRILEHIAAGLTNRQIGKEMALAEKTVKDYVTAVQAKLGIERRTQVAVFAVTDEGGGQRRHT
jgi:two-component system, NarL family, response regulator DevR